MPLPPPPPRRTDSQQLRRQWALIRLLAGSPTGWSVKDLATQLGVTKSTIDRDLATLNHDFSLIEESAGKQKKTYRLDAQVRELGSISFGTTELLAIYAANAALGGLAATPIGEDLRSVIAKVRGFLGPRYNGGLNALVEVFATHVRGGVDYGAKAELIDDLADAVARRRVVKLTYTSPWQGTTRTHEARVLRLVWHRAALYALACLGKHERITTLAVQRIDELVKTDEVFASPQVDVDAHIQKAFGIFVSDREEDVEIVFDKEIAWRVEERTFHPDERKERQPDGSLRFRLRSSAQWEIIPWVQSFGPSAELIAPASWRELMRQSAEATARRYRDGT